MTREYYVCQYKLKNKNCYLIWYSDDIDGVYKNSDEVIFAFNSKFQLTKYADEEGGVINENSSSLHDLDMTLNF